MAYSTGQQARLLVSGGIAAVPSSGAGITGGSQIFSYCSSHSAVDIVATGFFVGAGAQPYSSSGESHYNVRTRSVANIGMRPGDLLVNIESSAGATPGRVSWHAVSASTWSGSTLNSTANAGYDITVSAHAST
jgi:hypothetical protein